MLDQLLEHGGVVKDDLVLAVKLDLDAVLLAANRS